MVSESNNKQPKAVIIKGLDALAIILQYTHYSTSKILWHMKNITKGYLTLIKQNDNKYMYKTCRPVKYYY